MKVRLVKMCSCLHWLIGECEIPNGYEILALVSLAETILTCTTLFTSVDSGMLALSKVEAA